MYDVALLIESQLEDLDADQVVELHEGLEDTVRYHLLLPVESSAAALTSSMTALGSGHAAVPDPAVLDEVETEIVRSGQAELAASAALFEARGQQTTSRLVETDPVDALKELVAETGSDEVIILTATHFVKEFFHVDWTSRAKRVLDVPTLHLLERIPIEAQG
jgi:hypothetical protein